MPTRLQHVQELFEAALAREPDDRAAFLAEACGDDAELRAEVESLLAHDQQAGERFMCPLEPPAGVRHSEVGDGPDPLIGTKVGNYQIKSVIAAGGMGTVYEAVQEQPERIVALKVMRPYVASRSALRRFQFEAQILGRLRHPNIAQVYEAGIHRDREGILGPAGGVPYFAMEYIPGAKTITQYAEQEGLDTRERLRLFAKACDAVHHGHQKGIIHRDLKPGNILVDSTGEPKVIDFGVARATDSDLAITTQQTVIGQLIGTVQYMSPEQCDADPHDLDTRSDVYSLGVVLYELLTGELPYDASSSTIYQATRAIKEDEPRKLSAINPKLRGDVETIALKALEKDREKRYQSAADLARDIRRFLNRDPIEARPPTAWTRGVRWLGRNPVIATIAACLSIGAIIIGATTLSVGIVNARPYEIVLLKRPGCKPWHGGHEARLLAFSGKILHTWRGEPPADIRFAELVKRPAKFGGGRLAVLGFDSAQSHRFPGYLCAFDVARDLENPLWKRRIETEHILPELRDLRHATAEEFFVQQAWVFDVFPEREFPQHPGPEIIASFARGSYSQRVIRIYDLAGELLYQVWHDGSVHSCYWMSDARLLVFAGDCHWPYHDAHGSLLGDKVKDFVVFALRPEPGFIARDDYLDYTSSKLGDDRLAPAWYLRLRLRSWPKDAVEVAERITLRPPGPTNDPARCVSCVVHVDDRIRANVSWVINEFGERTDDKPVVTDGYRNNQNRPDNDPDKIDLPDPDDFKLEPFELTASAPSESAPDGARDSSDGENDGP